MSEVSLPIPLSMFLSFLFRKKPRKLVSILFALSATEDSSKLPLIPCKIIRVRKCMCTTKSTVNYSESRELGKHSEWRYTLRERERERLSRA